ncbi:ERI1 exoribonuclease 3 [Orussus abietinus]|uniref:ERI1 exoribonuclease 3 n=1 Tax=Orussus abietinus TaxID=222816 RepID=UPI0006262443|nr:ERI1 exoribonuclease 3 [Orussus abietinus]
MAHRVFLGSGKHFVNKTVDVVQRFNYLLVLDFEATCVRSGKIEPQEIIEFPCMTLSTQDWKVKDVFHEYVKPRVHPLLSSFCMDLTGIVQEKVDGGASFPETMSKFSNWLSNGGYFRGDCKSAFVTCGDWDLKVMLPSQCALERLEVPDCFETWIDLKKIFADTMHHYPRSMMDMLTRLEIKHTGKLHSGIDDTQNMVKIIEHLAVLHNANFVLTSSIRHLHRIYK